MNKLIFLFIILSCTSELYSQKANRYIVSFTDKENSLYSIDSPDEFLSERAIERRQKQNIPISLDDIPVNINYIQQVTELGVKHCNTSKWFNSIVVEIDSAFDVSLITNLNFVKDIKKVGPATKAKPYAEPIQFETSSNYNYNEINNYSAEDFYGISLDQINIFNGYKLHKDGFMGQGMRIAIIDAGFIRVDSITAFQNAWDENRIIAYKDFSGSDINVFEEGYHGMAVFSLIGSYLPGKLIGTAPRAEYLLLRTEEGQSEFPVEEENWIAAAEFADSLGVDIINSSLGYSEFDEDIYNYSYKDMDGETARISLAADIASTKGMLVVTSAGNSGNKPWKYITAPGDAHNVITVGACTRDSLVTSFSSRGPTFDGRIKPEVTTLGYYPSVVTINGLVKKSSMGTSFSSPLTAGMIACLWQEFPHLTNEEIRNAVIKSSHAYYVANESLGYGIPNFELARKILRIEQFSRAIEYAQLFPNPFSNKLKLEVLYSQQTNVHIEMYDLQGKEILTENFPLQAQLQEYEIPNVAELPQGVYIVVIHFGNKHYIQKVTKKID